MLFDKQVTLADTRSGYVPFAVLAERFAENPDPLLAEMGGSRVDVAIGVDRTMYQLEVQQAAGSVNVTVSWVKAETSSRRPKPGVSVPIAGEVPVTLPAAVSSLCSTFGLSAEDVWKNGVDLLAFWEGSQANERLELPMSRDWSRYSLSQLHAH